VLELLRVHAPWLYELVQPAEFGLNRPLDLLQGAITPVVRRGYVPLRNGKFALALGDAHILNDPVTAQGANVASRAAWILGQAIMNDREFDQRFCETVEQRILEYALPVTEWTNAMLQPPPPHALEFLIAASQIPAVADAFVEGYNTPSRLWHILSSPERTTAFLHEYGWTGPPQIV
jgi:2-polyprenyl-6-methoxyphenol hydroxylase-like FAD-dependent oxidoreductase